MASAEFKPVDLVTPDGRPYTAQTPAEFHSLVYGHGYRPKSGTVAEVSVAATEAANAALVDAAPADSKRKTK